MVGTATLEPIEAASVTLAGARVHEGIAREELTRQILLASRAGFSQREIAQKARVSQPYVARLVRQFEHVPVTSLERPSGWRPMAVAYKYAGGQISRETMLEVLSTWDYFPAPGAPSDTYSDFSGTGEWEEVVDVANRGLLSDADYDLIAQQSVARRGRPSAADVR